MYIYITFLFLAELRNIYNWLTRGKWIRGYGTKFVWNSVRSTLRAPSNRKLAVIDETICPIKRFKFVYVGLSMLKFLLHNS